MGGSVTRYSVFSRINVLLGVLIVALSPVLFELRRIQDDAMTSTDWARVVLLVALIQVLFWNAVSRCSSPRLTYWRGLTSIAACMRTGWTYTDVLLGALVLPVAIVCSIGFAMTPRAALLFHRMVYRLYEYRMVQ